MLLALLMLPVLRQKSAGRSTPGRLTISNAWFALGASPPTGTSTPSWHPSTTPQTSTPQSSRAPPKLLAYLFLWELTERVTATDVVVNLADPGFVKGAEFGREADRRRGGARPRLGSLELCRRCGCQW